MKCLLGWRRSASLHLFALALLPLAPAGAMAFDQRGSAALEAMRRAAGSPVNARVSPTTGALTFLAVPHGAVPIAGAAAPAAERARVFLQTYGTALALPAPDDVAVLSASPPDAVGMEHVRLQQLHRGLPVRAAQLTVHLRGNGVVAVHARTVRDISAIDTVPTVSVSAVLDVVRRVVVDNYGIADAVPSTPQLEVFNHGLFDGQRHPTRLAWYVEAQAPQLRAWVWVDAHTSEVLFHLNQLPQALYREIRHLSPIGLLLRAEGDPPTGEVDVDNIYEFTGDTYDYFFAKHGRDSYDGAGATMLAVANSGCCISFWVGSYAAFSDVVVADDIVAHEWTHGVTQFSAGLIYSGQPAAMNESYSDIFGETVDLLNGAGNDSPAARWALFEDFVAPPGFRNMMDPPSGLGEPGPGKMSDPQLDCVNQVPHVNGGVTNHAYALMVDGGSYNNHTIQGIGLTKSAKIEYRSLTEYLVPVSTFQDQYDALQQACNDLIGSDGVTAADCGEVQKALDSVEMYFPWPCNCGNGSLDAGEECDDTNMIDGDGCDSNCTVTACGNGIVTDGEQCDGGDCCTPGCSFAQSGAVCPSDGDPCTQDVCNADGTCEHLATSSCTLDHYKCYQGTDLDSAPFASLPALTADQITTETVTVQKVKFVCSPVDKNGEGINDPSAHLVCYQVKGSKLAPPPSVQVSTQFQVSQFQMKKPKLLCLPGTKTLLP